MVILYLWLNLMITSIPVTILEPGYDREDEFDGGGGRNAILTTSRKLWQISLLLPPFVML